MNLAGKTLALIDECIEKDGGALFRKNLGEILPKITDAFRADDPPFRRHLGASLIGRNCSRELWYSFRWAFKNNFPARIQRLFNRGHLEEARFIAMLQMIGVECWYEDEGGGQLRFSDINGHFGSALDCVTRGLPELPKDAVAYAEFKTCSDKIFKKLSENGIQKEKHEHYVQMQICMYEMNLKYGLYFVVNKNDDALYAEIIELNENIAKNYLDRAGTIIYSDEVPAKLNEDSSWYQCKFCNARPICHLKVVPEINCRTCAHSTVEKNGLWSCGMNNTSIHNDAVYNGCDDHVYNPYMLDSNITFNGGSQDYKHADLTLPNGDRILQGPLHVTSKQFKENFSG